LDIATLVGIIGGPFLVFFSIFMESGFDFMALKAYANLPGLMIIVGGTGGATVLSFTLSELKNLPGIVKKVFFNQMVNSTETVTLMVGFAGKARREGLLGLEEDIAEIQDKFLQKGLQLVVDGTDMEMIREILETDVAFMETRHKVGAEIFTAAGGYSPTLGIIGAVAGLISAMGTVSDPSKLAGAIAVAFTATFYGIGIANLFLLPIASKLAAKNRDEVFIKELQLVGVLSISAGDNPRIVEEKMKAFLPPAERLVLEAQTKKE
jgi:chemotaxis protein MotA